jgi:hypothetical protein
MGLATLSAIGVTLPLSDIYEDVPLDPETVDPSV